MADTNGVPRRVSMAYILGFSDKPYREVRSLARPPLPQAGKPTEPVNMISTPGRIMEWTASDGRKGKLTGAGKPRLTAASLAKVTSDKRSTKEALGAKGASKRAASNKPAADGHDPWGGNTGNTSAKDTTKESSSKQGDEEAVEKTGNASSDPLPNTWENTGGVLGGDDENGATKNPLADDGPTTDGAAGLPVTTGTEYQQVNDNNPHGFTKEQDEKLLQWKAENTNKPWVDCASEVDKQASWCMERFNQIKTKDWKPNASNQGGGDKKAKSKEKNQGKGDNKKDRSKESNSFATDTDNDKKGDVDKANDTKGNGSKNATGAYGNKVVDGGGTTDGYAATTNREKNKNKSTSNTLTSRALPQHGASENNAQPITARPLELKVKPDDSFSADDLRLVARILQQDCSMVWNRVSWRFRDKTGRTLHPDDFERKITGRLGSKDSEKGKRRK
ncbi:hypothetical protein G6011_04781 [Alternaria panax]|uniref:Myb-like domain-containing protein n=1 Tax=Alternaria panax TaxID=48097 RepID=A0AAD4IHZ2_9PLEO|nr:hypothetical protein G6011_04781 [Alternaria panax]